MADYKSTVNLPQTDFAMKADLARREPAMQKWWEENDIYGELRKVARGARASCCTTGRRMRTA